MISRIKSFIKDLKPLCLMSGRIRRQNKVILQRNYAIKELKCKILDDAVLYQRDKEAYEWRIKELRKENKKLKDTLELVQNQEVQQTCMYV